MSFAEKYLQILGLPFEKPSLPYLTKLVRSQLIHFPYENVSKLQMSADQDLRLPSEDEYLEGSRVFGYGGTCYSQNSFFPKLLNQLGFSTEMIRASVSGVSGTHLSSRVRIENKSYIVDFGFLDPFSGPFDEFGGEFKQKLGGRLFKFLPLPNNHFRIEIHNDQGLQRHFDSEKKILDPSEIDSSVLASFDLQALFMKTLVIGSRTNKKAFTLWNEELVISEGDSVKKEKARNLKDLKDLVHLEMNLALYPIDEVVKIIQSRGSSIFSESI